MLYSEKFMAVTGRKAMKFIDSERRIKRYRGKIDHIIKRNTANPMFA